jgi:hypothetical protein
MFCTSSSRRIDRTARSDGNSLSRGFRYNSLFENILRISPWDARFCGGLFFLALCFEYFTNKRGEGFYPRNSLECQAWAIRTGRRIAFLTEKTSSIPVRIFDFGLCADATLVYGVRSFKYPKRMCHPAREVPRLGGTIPVLWPGTDLSKGKPIHHIWIGWHAGQTRGDTFSLRRNMSRVLKALKLTRKMAPPKAPTNGPPTLARRGEADMGPGLGSGRSTVFQV